MNRFSLRFCRLNCQKTDIACAVAIFNVVASASAVDSSFKGSLD